MDNKGTILWFKRQTDEVCARVNVFRYNDTFNYVVIETEFTYDCHLYAPSLGIMQQFYFNPVDKSSITRKEYMDQIRWDIKQEITEYSNWFLGGGVTVDSKKKAGLFPNIPISGDMAAKIDTFRYGNFCVDVLTFNGTYSAWLYMADRPSKICISRGTVDVTVGKFLRRAEKNLESEMTNYRRLILNEQQTG